MRPSSGVVLSGRYKLTDRIAIGGMGEVWKADDMSLDRVVAVKILKEEYAADPTFLERFRAEARNMGSLSNPGIANVFDFGEDNESPYLVMEYVPGKPLSDILEREKVLSTDRTLSYLSQAALALHAAHSAGVVHRDVKPGNILVTPDERVKLTDFGIARVTNQVPLTKTGQVMGTAQYLAPEQATGKTAAPSSDVYALGIIGYEALAGERPFSGDTQVAIAMKQVNEPAPELPANVPEPVRALIATLLRKNPAERPKDAYHLSLAADALRRHDVAAAEYAVPEMAQAGSDAPTVASPITSGSAPTSIATTVSPQPRPTSDTAQMPVVGERRRSRAADGAGAGAAAVAGADGTTRDDAEKSGRGGRIAGIIIGIVIALAIIVFVLMATVFKDPAGSAAPTDTPSSSAPSSTGPTNSPSSSPQTVTIDPDDYIGQSSSDARTSLQSLGLGAHFIEVTSSSESGTVVRVSPGSNGYTFDEGATVTMAVSKGPAKTSRPSDEDSSGSSTTAPSAPSTSGDEGSSDTSSPDSDTSDSGKSDTGNSDTGKSDSGDSGKSDTGNSDTGKSGGTDADQDDSDQDASPEPNQNTNSDDSGAADVPTSGQSGEAP
ncbi:protein kinase domain-containing protein [Spelaeicoccus albus]|uniref:non-specific serine/threonine protein kinase n=1 Tax=Spelaeicoccus albus TaxID=1280376 RepID=A0A7Z0D194_9MICO|nr:protein kinase [Spelaeicoccus albus]NYI66608.1 serine/threonine-protein kinase [Spelaeicoccus albus]